MNYLRTAPQSALDLLDSFWAEMASESELELAKALVTDDRMTEAWERLATNYNRIGQYTSVFGTRDGWGETFLRAAVMRYSQANAPDPWDLLTRTEQLEWFDRFDLLTKQLTRHLGDGPLKPDSLGSFVPPPVLEQIMPPKEEGKVRKDPRNVRWGLSDSLELLSKRYRELFVDDQWMKRPRHPKSARERFIFLLSGDCEQYFGQPLQKVVVATTAVAFNDDTVDERLVRRITSDNLYRQDSIENS